MSQPRRSPYCECAKHKCSCPGYYDARHVPFKWKENQMESFDKKLRELLNTFGIDNDTGVPDYILEKFLCSIIDNLTEQYQSLPKSQDLTAISQYSEVSAKIMKEFKESFIRMQADIVQHKGDN